MSTWLDQEMLKSWLNIIVGVVWGVLLDGEFYIIHWIKKIALCDVQLTWLWPVRSMFTCKESVSQVSIWNSLNTWSLNNRFIDWGWWSGGSKPLFPSALQLMNFSGFTISCAPTMMPKAMQPIHYELKYQNWAKNNYLFLFMIRLSLDDKEVSSWLQYLGLFALIYQSSLMSLNTWSPASRPEAVKLSRNEATRGGARSLVGVPWGYYSLPLFPTLFLLPDLPRCEQAASCFFSHQSHSNYYIFPCNRLKNKPWTFSVDLERC